ncbi:MAG: NAD(P)/FAD-dependent oxidoreductase [Gammaproteobacteria bacterium]|nr:NAD(P)/FAD-dependent oxidoreductase [Gammaproteobacteria bacterium]
MSEQPARTVAIVGGGFAGITVARRLERQLPDHWRILLLSRENYITYNPLLAEVVGASILPGHVVAPIRQMVHRSSFRMVNVSRVDLEQRRLIMAEPDAEPVHWDRLVLACGVRADLGRVPGMAEHAVPLKLLGDALALRNRILVQLERAARQPDPEVRRALTRFVVVGGGFSGVEVAGEIQDFLAEAVRYYPEVDAADCRVAVVHSRDRLLNEISEGLGRYAEKRMRRNGIDIHLGARVAQVDGRGVELSGGGRVEGATVVATIGTAPMGLIEGVALPKEKGRIVTAPDLSVQDHPDIWALGDCAWVINQADGQPSPPTAQFAVRQAALVADNLVRREAGRDTRPFHYRSRGQLASIGHNKAVAEIYGLRLSGFPAWLLWRGFYLLQIPTLLRKVRVYFEWNWQMLFPPDIVHLRFTRSGDNRWIFEADGKPPPNAGKPEGFRSHGP